MHPQPDPAWAPDPALDSTEGRLAAHYALDARLAEWTRARTPQAAMETLCAHRVPAGGVQRSRDLLRDPQYAHRGFHRYLEHPETGRVPYAGSQFRMAGYGGSPERPAPLLGEHNDRVLREYLGLSDDEIADAIASGAIQ